MTAAVTVPMVKKVLVVDDDQDMCWIFDIALADLGYAVTTVGSAQSAFSLVADNDFPIAFVDARLPDMDGLQLIAELRGLRPAMRVIMISGYYLKDDVRILEAEQAATIDGFLAKPFQIEAIVAAVIGKGQR
jgi:DNA-binding NtrC family response regulator